MGFFSDLGKGIASVVKAPFEGVGALVKGVGEGVGSILHGSASNPQGAPQFMAQSAQQFQAQDPMMAMQMMAMQNAMLTHMLMHRQMYPHCLCG